MNVGFTRFVPAMIPAEMTRNTPRSIPEQIATVISRRILSGEIPHGVHLKGPELAEQFNVSRATIHDALRIVERYGVVQIIARRGAYVTYAGASEISDVLDIRAALFGLASRRACEASDDTFIEAVEDYVAKLRSLADAPETKAEVYADISLELQRTIARQASNSRLSELLDELVDRQRWPQQFRESPMDHDTVERRQQSATLWGAVRDAFVAGNAEAAEKAATHLIQVARNHMSLRSESKKTNNRTPDA